MDRIFNFLDTVALIGAGLGGFYLLAVLFGVLFNIFDTHHKAKAHPFALKVIGFGVLSLIWLLS